VGVFFISFLSLNFLIDKREKDDFLKRN